MKNLLKDVAVLMLITFIAIMVNLTLGINAGYTATLFVAIYFFGHYIVPSHLYQSFALMGFVRECGLRSGGGTTLYLAKKEDVDEFTLGTLADATKWATVTMVATAKFSKYEFEPKTCEFKQDVSIENGSAKVTKSIEFMLPKMSQASRDAVEEIKLNSSCGLVGICVDANGQAWVVGYTDAHKMEYPLGLATGAGTTGKALTDANGWTVTLTCEDTEEARTFTGVVPV